MAASDVITDEVRSLSYWLEEVPKTLFGGFDRKATRQLVAKLDASYRDVVVQREKLLTELEKMQAFSAEFERRERELVAEAERLAGELATSQEEQGSLRRQLECARTRWDAELARAKADLERELEQARVELADYRRREVLLAQVARTARSRAEAVTREARDEAERMLRRARRRESAITSDAERELERLEAERQRLLKLAVEFRHDMAERLLETLEQLSPSEPEAGPDEELPSDEGSVAEHSDDQTR